MCGIAGIVNFNGRPVDARELGAMNDALIHRGPDGEGTFREGNIGLAHRRLAIIDPRLGAQPIFNDDRTVVLSYNGEVYNYREIRDELTDGFDFRTESDTEVVLRAYEKWGMACLERFRGMFACALYDGRSGVLYLVRDRLGIKPLYYCHTNDRLLFSSELAPLLKADVPREIDPEAVAGYFRYQYVPTPATIYKDVRKLEPGHFLEVNVRDGSVVDRRYWRLPVDVTDRSEADCLAELDAALRDTARIYVRSDVPFGAFLSGGVDSSLVTALMGEHLSEPVRTFSIGFYEREHSELPFAAEASRVLQTNHYEKVVSPQAALDVLRKLVVHFGEPFADSSAVPTYYVSREAASQVKMVLSGDGGDELFGGYWSYETTFRDMMNPLHGLRTACARLLAACAPTPGFRRWASVRSRNHAQKHNAQRELFDDAELRALLVPGVSVPHRPTADVDVRGEAPDLVTGFQAQDAKSYLFDDVLTKVDRTSMANSLEVRVPLLDHKIVELAFRLPLSLKLRLDAGAKRVRTKYLLKKSAARYFSESFLDRPKQGFGIPIIEWCRDPLRSLIEDGLRHARNPVFDWLRLDTVQTTLDRFFAGDDSLVAKVWSMLMFDLWMKEVHAAR